MYIVCPPRAGFPYQRGARAWPVCSCRAADRYRSQVPSVAAKGVLSVSPASGEKSFPVSVISTTISSPSSRVWIRMVEPPARTVHGAGENGTDTESHLFIVDIRHGQIRGQLAGTGDPDVAPAFPPARRRHSSRAGSHPTCLWPDKGNPNS